MYEVDEGHEYMDKDMDEVDKWQGYKDKDMDKDVDVIGIRNYTTFFIFMRTTATLEPMYPIFLETLGKTQFNRDDPKHYDHHLECPDDKECPTSTDWFLMTIFPHRPHVSYILGNLGQYPG